MVSPQTVTSAGCAPVITMVSARSSPHSTKRRAAAGAFGLSLAPALRTSEVSIEEGTRRRPAASLL